MKRIAKQNGSGGRLRLGLLLATMSALLLVPASSAFAAPVPAKIVFAGSGAGWVKGSNTISNGHLEGGEPLIECHWNGTTIDIGVPGAGECETMAQEISPGLIGVVVGHEADPGSEFAGWKVEEGVALGCEQENPGAGTCGVASFGTPIKIKATFNEIPKPKFALNVTTSGTAGSVECKINGGAKGPCPTEVAEGKSVELLAVPGTGSELKEWTTGSCAGSSSSPCSFTMPAEAVSANAEFKVASESLSVTEGGGGTGSVACEVNASPAPCNGTYSYGDSVKVLATAASENKVESITGTGSASGACVNAETTATCEFVLHANSSVAVVFEVGGTKDAFDGNVHGEVRPETTLETGGCEDVDLGIFRPGIEETYPGTCTVTSTSTGGVTELRAEDPGSHPGHLENTEPGPSSPYYLEEPLKVKAGAGSLAPLTSQVLLHTYEAPVYKDAEEVEFSQQIKAGEPLRTGVYAKTITLTLEQTTP